MLTLWTVRPVSDFEILQKTGCFITDPTKIDQHRLRAYSWIAKQLSKKVLPPKDVQFPVWAWYRAHGLNQIKPDLRKTGYLEKGEKGVRIEFTIPDKDVLLSSFDGWHSVLNYHCFSITDEEYDYYEQLEINLSSDEFEKVKQQSWEKIFDLDLLPDPNIYEIQAVLWQLKLEWVKKVDFFTAR